MGQSLQDMYIMDGMTLEYVLMLVKYFSGSVLLSKLSNISCKCSPSSSFISAGQLFQPHRRTSGGFRVGGGVHDSYTFQCGLVGPFTSHGIDAR